jgi:hypothetical protein
MKKTLLISAFAFINLISFGQLDSVNVTTNFIIENNPTDSISSGDIMQVKVWVNDIDFLGQIIIDVIETSSNYPIVKVKYSVTEILNQNLVIDGWIVFDIGFFDPNSEYIIKTSVQNFQFLDLPQVIITHNGSN